MSADFERIYLNESKAHGRFRIAEIGLGWKAAASASMGGSAGIKAQPFLLPQDELSSAQWSRGSRGWELRIQTKNKGVVRLDGFDQEDFNQLKSEFQRVFNIPIDHKEHSLRGWNWGSADLARNEVVFQVNGKPSFEIPYKQISNSNLATKNEVAVELNLVNNIDNIEKTGDELVELRFFIPGSVDAEGNDNNNENNEEEEKSAAQIFYEQLKEKADIGQVSGEAIVSFPDTLFLTPRGRFDIDMYENSFRLRGKTYDHKVQFKQIERIFSLPKPDDIHHLMIIQINPPLRQGQTPYPYLVLQVSKDEEMEVEINMEEDEFKEKYENRLKKNYDSKTHLVLSHVFRGLAERRIIVPGSFTSRHGQCAVSCSLKVNEGYLYFLEKCFLFVTKPTVYIPYSDVSSVSISRAGDSSTSNRTFDLEILLRNSVNSHIFANISKDEQNSIQSFLKEKGIHIKNEEAEQQQRITQALKDELDDEDDEDVVMNSEDEESPDEDFKSGSDSDSDDDSEVSDGSGDSDAEVTDEPPLKKSKV